jgi:hypothetical protein
MLLPFEWFLPLVRLLIEARIMEHIYHYCSPGILTVLLAVLAAVTALPKVAESIKDRWWFHSLAILFFCLIAAAEIAVIHHADQVSDERFGTIVSSFKETQGLMAQYDQSMRGLMAAKAIAAAKPGSVKQSPKELVDLKLKAAILSTGILKLLVDRLQAAPAYPMNPRSATWEQDLQPRRQWDEATVALYHQMFGVDAKIVAVGLAKYGSKTEQLAQLAEGANNVLVVRMVAYQLGFIAGVSASPY